MMEKKRVKRPKQPQRNVKKSAKRRKAPPPKKLPAHIRRRNRMILYAVITSLIVFTFYKCSGDKESVVADQNSTTLLDKNISQDQNSTKNEQNITEATKELKQEIKDEKIDKNSVENEVKKEKKSIKDLFNSKQFPTDKILAKQQLLEKYRKKRSYKNALALAEYFYSQKSYKKAIEWAIVANKEDNQKERSWIIYAKSKIALGDKEKAKDAMEAYLKANNSKNLKKLLDSLSKEDR